MWYNKFKFTIGILRIAAVVTALGLIGLLFTSRPGGVVTLLFYLLLGLFSLSFWTLAGFHIRKFIGQREFSDQYLNVAARQGLWLTLILVFSLVLTSFGFFSWINALFLIFVFVFLESYLLTKN